MKRSTCASGSGYVPSYSTGFWVAKTMNGRRELVRVHVDGDVALLHALEQARLRLGRRAVDLVHEHDVGEDRPRPELEARLALVVDVGADDVGRQQVGRALHARELAVERARERARERGLADARIVLDEDVALGEEGDDDVAQHVVADLDGAADVVLDPPREADCGVDLRLVDGLGQGLSRLHRLSQTFRVVDERRLKTVSRMADATSAFVARGTWRSVSPVTIVTSLSPASKPMPGDGDVVDHDGVELLARELVAAVGDGARRPPRRRSRRSPARSGGARGEAGEHVVGALERERQLGAGVVLLDLAGVRAAGR